MLKQLNSTVIAKCSNFRCSQSAEINYLCHSSCRFKLPQVIYVFWLINLKLLELFEVCQLTVTWWRHCCPHLSPVYWVRCFPVLHCHLPMTIDFYCSDASMVECIPKRLVNLKNGPKCFPKMNIFLFWYYLFCWSREVVKPQNVYKNKWCGKFVWKNSAIVGNVQGALF